MNIFFCGYNLFSSLHKARLTNTKLLYLKIQIGIEKAAFLLIDKQRCAYVDRTDSKRILVFSLAFACYFDERLLFSEGKLRSLHEESKIRRTKKFDGE